MNIEKYYHSIFPVCVGAYNLNEYDQEEYENLKKLLLSDRIVENNHGLIESGTRSETSNFLENSHTIKLKENIQRCVDDYCQTTGIVFSIIKHSWVVKYQKE